MATNLFIQNAQGAGLGILARDSDSDTSGAIAQVLALNAHLVCACIAPACAYPILRVAQRVSLYTFIGKAVPFIMEHFEFSS